MLTWVVSFKPVQEDGWSRLAAFGGRVRLHLSVKKRFNAPFFSRIECVIMALSSRRGTYLFRAISVIEHSSLIMHARLTTGIYVVCNATLVCV